MNFVNKFYINLRWLMNQLMTVTGGRSPPQAILPSGGADYPWSSQLVMDTGKPPTDQIWFYLVDVPCELMCNCWFMLEFH